MEVITLREYARRKGVSLTAIQHGLAAGRITAIVDSNGKRTGIDWTTQEHAWEANSKHPQKKAHHQAGGRPRKDGTPAAPPSTGPARTVIPPAPPPEDQAKPGAMSLADIQRARELVKLQIDNEKLKVTRGESVPAAEQEKLGRQLAAAVVSGMYVIPDRISDELAGMSDPNAIHELLLKQIDEAVSELRKAFGAD